MGGDRFRYAGCGASSITWVFRSLGMAWAHLVKPLSSRSICSMLAIQEFIAPALAWMGDQMGAQPFSQPQCLPLLLERLRALLRALPGGRGPERLCGDQQQGRRLRTAVGSGAGRGVGRHRGPITALNTPQRGCSFSAPFAAVPWRPCRCCCGVLPSGASAWARSGRAAGLPRRGRRPGCRTDRRIRPCGRSAGAP